jgi:hypothetical protein
MKTWQPAVLAMALILASACGEVETVPTQAPTEAVPRTMTPDAAPRRSIAIGSQTPPSSVPPEYQHYTWLDVVADVGFLPSNYAYGQAIVSYGGNNATAGVTLSARNTSGTQVAVNSGSAQDSHVFPANYSLTASTNMYLPATCGLSVQATAVGSAWDEFFNTGLSVLKWGQRAGSDSKTAVQSACAPPPTCQDYTATNYGGPLPCTYPAPTGGATPPSTPTTGTATYSPPTSYGTIGHWECTTWNSGTEYEVRNCIWVQGYGARIASSDASLTRLVASGPAYTLAEADLPSVFVIVSDQLPAGAMAVVERHRQGPQTNVLLVPSSNVRPAVFVAAMRALYDSRAKDGETPAKELTLELKGTVLDQQVPAALRDYAAAFTALVASAKRANAGAYGTRPIVEFRMGAPKQ